MCALVQLVAAPILLSHAGVYIRIAVCRLRAACSFTVLVLLGYTVCMALATHPFVRWVRHHISSIAFATGFVWDTLTLNRIDLLYENFVFVSYLMIAFVGILLIHGVETGRWKAARLLRYKAWLPALVQFPLGGVFSGFVIFYTKSAAFWTSWPFLLLLFALFVGNEFFRRRYERLVFQMSVLFFALTSYLILVTPVVLGTVGDSTFVLSTLLALFVFALLTQIVMRLFPELYKRSVRGLWLSVLGVFALFQVFYFTHVIPPVPLVLTEIGIYHSVVRTDGVYQVAYEEPHNLAWWRDTARTFTRGRGSAAYCFASIFAPTSLRAKVQHSWQRKTEEGAWVREAKVPYTVAGGRDHGYRGYTFITNALQPGTWKCAVELENGQVIGETVFEVVDGEPELVRGER